MKILIITSLYPDDSPIRRTNAVHELVRYWTEEHQVVCFKEEWISIIINPKKRMQLKAAGCNGEKRLFIKQLCSLIGWRYLKKDGVDIYRFSCLSSPFSEQSKSRFGDIEKIFYRIMAYKMNKRLKTLSYEPDVVIVHMPVRACIKYIQWLNVACPKLAVFHGSDVRKLRNRADIQRIDNLQLLNNRFAAIFARSDSIYKEMRENGEFQNLRKDIIYSGVPAMQHVVDKKWDIKKKYKILFVGDLVPTKGVHTILHSLNQIKGIERYISQFCIIGDGVEQKKLNELVGNLDLTELVKFRGRVSRECVYEEMRETDIFVMVSENETLGLVYLEAMANGCITIGSKNEGIDGIIKDGENGFLVNALSVNELSDVLEKIFSMSVKELEKISKKAIETANFHNLEDMSSRYLDIVKREMRCYEGA